MFPNLQKAKRMNPRIKNAIYSVVLLVAIVAIWYYRQGKAHGPMIKLEGQTMGTTYHVSYFDPQNRNFKTSIDSLLVLINKSINNYDSGSDVSRFNRAKESFRFTLPYFLPPIKKSAEVFSGSLGAFDPTVMPLVYAFGFGADKNRVFPDSAKIDSIKSFVGFEKIQFNADSVWKTDARSQLDFGGIGQGYGADVMTDFLKSKGIENALVELGGEGMAIGKNLEKKKAWELGILDPNSTRDSLFYKAYVKLTNQGFSTSGNYFNYRVVDGKKFSHTIDPNSGYPIQRSILSATVFAKDCITADAWATAFMVMGFEKAKDVLTKHPELNVFFVYTAEDGTQKVFQSEGIKNSIEMP
jgi:thiamine biosynthesis lipoprotein